MYKDTWLHVRAYKSCLGRIFTSKRHIVHDRLHLEKAPQKAAQTDENRWTEKIKRPALHSEITTFSG